jgi:hypothetical protein
VEELVAEVTYPICERDGFPMLKINGRWECVAEYLDRCIGQQAVVDLVQRGKTVYLVFESGHELPMLCFCCGTPLAYRDLERARRNMRGRSLESMSVGPVTLEDGREMLQFVLEFSKKGLLSRGISIPVAIEVAARLKHPDNCPHKKRSSTKRSSSTKKRHRRKRR